MSKSIKMLAILGVVGGVAACAKKAEEEEFVVVHPEPTYHAPTYHEPISHEPVYTGKYK